ncbi:hypothetical protein, partial [Arthrobacter sp. DR-2P]
CSRHVHRCRRRRGCCWRMRSPGSCSPSGPWSCAWPGPRG